MKKTSEAHIPYGRQWVNEDDIAAVVAILRGDWLTTGPTVAEFERRLATAVGTREAVAVSSGTAALHAAMFALGIKPGDEVIVPAITFVAKRELAWFIKAARRSSWTWNRTPCSSIHERSPPRSRPALAPSWPWITLANLATTMP